MRLLFPLFGALLLTACPPPDAVDGGGEPVVTLLFPEPDQRIMANADGTVDITAVIHVANFALSDPSADNSVEAGVGHWHFAVEGSSYVPSFTNSASYLMPADDANAPSTGEVRILVKADLHDGSHGIIVLNDGSSPSDQTEVILVPFAEGADEPDARQADTGL